MELPPTDSTVGTTWPSRLAAFGTVVIAALLGWYGEGFAATLLLICSAVIVGAIAFILLLAVWIRRRRHLPFRRAIRGSAQCALVATISVVSIFVARLSDTASVAQSMRRAETIIQRIDRFHAETKEYPETLAELERTDGAAIPRPTISREPFNYWRSNSQYGLSFHGTFIASYTYSSEDRRWHDEDGRPF